MLSEFWTALHAAQVSHNTWLILRGAFQHDATGLAEIVKRDIESLVEAGLTATQGDIRCICFGHLTRLAIWNLRGSWDNKRPVNVRMETISLWLKNFGGAEAVLRALEQEFSKSRRTQSWTSEYTLRETEGHEDEISF